MSSRALRHALLWAAGLLAPQAALAAPVGTTAGEFAVTPAGAATYAMPITLPPGTAGMQPKLAVVYDSQADGTILGEGFSLSGLSVISRCPAALDPDGFIDGIDYDADDRFCLDGQRLVAVAGTYGGVGTEYRTEIETFSKIVSVGGSANDPGYFKVYTKSGLVMEYGNSVDSRWEAVTALPIEDTVQTQCEPPPDEHICWEYTIPGYTPPGYGKGLTWALAKVTDTAGNFYVVEYSENSTTGEHLPDEIAYSGHTSGVLPNTLVSFIYENRPDADVRTRFFAGSVITQSKRLLRIEARAAGAPARTYAFTYDAGGHVGASRLTSVTECAGSSCLNPTQFSWTAPHDFAGGYIAGGDTAGVNHFVDSSPYAPYDIARVMYGDFDADGLTDIYVVPRSGVAAAASIHYGRPDGSYSPASTGPIHLASADKSVYEGFGGVFFTGVIPYMIKVADLNADGFSDVYEMRPNEPARVHLNQKNGAFVTIAGPVHARGSSKGEHTRFGDRLRLVDLNGDGLTDLFWIGGFDCAVFLCTTSIHMNQGGGVFAPTPVNGPQVPISGSEDWATANVNAVKTGDFNGDGLTDVYVISVQQNWGSYSGVLYLQASNGAFGASNGAPHTYVPSSAARASNHVSKIQIADFNGDGMSDVLRINNSGPMTVWLARGDSTFSPAVNGPTHVVNMADTGVEARDIARVKLADLNGDGRTDFYIIKNMNGTTDQGEIYLSRGHYYGLGSGQHQLAFEYRLGSTHGINSENAEWAVRGLSRFNFIELNGDGIPELYYNRALDNTIPAVVLHFDFNEGDRVATITNGLGADIDISYRHLSRRFGNAALEFYTKGTGAQYPVMDVQGPLAMVLQHGADDGIGGTRTVKYKYSGLRMRWRGRGLLGFETHTASDQATGITETTTFRQDFPFIGMASASVTKVGDGRTLADGTTTYASQTLGSGASARRFVYAQTDVARAYEIEGVNRVITTTVTQNEFLEPTQYGNLTRSTVDVYEGLQYSSSPFRTVNENTYSNDAVQWRLGRLERSTVTRSAPGTVPATRVSAFDYDGKGMLSAETVEPEDPALWLRKDYDRDAYGNIIGTTVSGPDIASRTTSVAFDERGQYPVSATNALGHVEQYVLRDPATGLVTKLRGPNGLTTTFTQDAFGRSTGEIRPDTTSTTVIRESCFGATPACASGNVLRIVTQGSNGAKGIVEYDVLERATRTLTLTFDGSWSEALTTFNAKGQLATKSAPRFLGDTAYWTTFEYDAAGRLKKEIAPVDQVNVTGSISEVFYSGLTTEYRNPAGQTEEKTVNALGKTVLVRDNLGGLAQYFYDSFDNLVRTVDQAGNQVVMSYDIRGRKTGMSDPDMGSWTYAYNALGELKSQTDAKLQTVSMAYDLLGRMVSRAEGFGGIDITTWTYDQRWKGALASVVASGYRREHYYDPLGRPTIVDYTIGDADYSYAHNYDAQGRLLSLTYPSGFWVVHEYNATGHQARVSTSASNLFDVISCGAASHEGVSFSTCAVANAAATTEIWRLDETDAWGHQTRFTLGNGAVTDNIHDLANGRLGTIMTGVAGGPDVQSLNYAWSPIGNLDSRTDQLQGGLSETFGYDGLNRMTSSQVSTGGDPALSAITVEYDAIGNILSKSNVGAYTYGPRPHAVTATVGTRTAVYAYDANGNQLSGAGRTITWTHHNRPALIQRGANSTSFSYGPDRERIRQDSSQVFSGPGVVSKSTIYVGGLYESEAVSGLPTPVVARHYIQAGGRIVAMHTRNEAPTGPQLGTLRYLHHDHLGSVDKITDEAGAVVEAFSFDAFGKRRQSNWLNDPSDAQLDQAHATDKGYTSQQQLDGVALIHYGGRVYDPILGRFTSSDPIIQAPEDTQSFNRYAYVRNNPLAFTDPSGFSWWGKQVNRLSRETHRWERDFRHEIRRPNSLLGPMIVIASAVACGPAAGACGAGTSAAVAGATAVGVARAQGVTSGSKLLGAGIVAAWSAGVAHGINTQVANPLQNAIWHGVAGGLATGAQGGEFHNGFLAAFTGAAAGNYGLIPNHPVVGPIAAAVVGGTASALGGGKFANGAVTGAFAYSLGRVLRQAQSRPLTSNEIAEAQLEYGTSIDYSKVRVFGSKWFPLQGTNVAMAPDGNIYWPAAAGCADLTACSITIDGRSYSTLPTFIHEMGHVMQYQSGLNVIMSAGPLQLLHYATFGLYSPYLSAAQYARIPTSLGLNVEAQADWHMHNFCQSTGRC